MSNSAGERELNIVTHLEVVCCELSGRDNDDDILAFSRNVEMYRGAHHFRDVNLCCNTIVAKIGVLRTDTKGDILALDIVGKQALFLLLAQLDLEAAKLCKVLLAFAGKLCIEEVHLRSADKAGNEEIAGVIEDFLRSTDLLDITITHDDDSITEGHSLSLVVGNIDKGGIDTLTELDNLCTHLVTQLCIEVGQRLIHQEDSRVTDDCTADCNTLALTTGQSLRLTVEVLGNVKNLCCFADFLVNDVLLLLAELEGECHILINRHVRIQSVVLEYHCDISVFRCDVIHELAVDVELAFGNLFQTGDHTKRGGLSAAGRTDENDEFLICNIKVEFLNGYNTLIGNLQIDLLLFCGLTLFLLVLFLILAADERINLLDVFQLNSCHISQSRTPCLRKRCPRVGFSARFTTGLHTAAPRTVGLIPPFECHPQLFSGEHTDAFWMKSLYRMEQILAIDFFHKSFIDYLSLCIYTFGKSKLLTEVPMKRSVTLFICALMLFSLSACGNRYTSSSIPEDSEQIDFSNVVTVVATPTPMPAITPEPTPVPTPSPAPTATPVPTATPSPKVELVNGGNVFITKSPTSETVDEGGSASFVAYGGNFTNIVWILVSPDAATSYDAAEAPYHFSGVNVSGQGSSMVTFSNIPAGMDGWRVQAYFTGTGGPVYTNGAYITVLTHDPGYALALEFANKLSAFGAQYGWSASEVRDFSYYNGVGDFNYTLFKSNHSIYIEVMFDPNVSPVSYSVVYAVVDGNPQNIDSTEALETLIKTL